MKKRLFIYTTIIIFAGLLGFLAVSIFVTNRNNISLAKSTVRETTRISAGLFHADVDLFEFVNAGEDTRITVISADGSVLADSHPPAIPTIENRLLRPEIIAADVGFPEVHIRYSATHNADFIYYALKVPTDESHVFVRVAIPVAQIDAYLLQSLPLLLFLLAALSLICFFVIRGVANRILEPFNAIEHSLRMLSQGEYTPIAKSFDEIEKITREIDDIAFFLQKNYDALRSEKNKLAYILNSISDGLFVIDDNIDITLINTAAYSIFGIQNVEGKKLNYLVSDKGLATTIEECIRENKNTFFEYSFCGKIYLVTIKRLPDTDLTICAMTDITESRENAKNREEFFANASHELKTPLTAIRGFNELAGINNKDEQLNKYIEGITRETTRMMGLISDMLKLSELENTSRVTKQKTLALATIVNEARDTVFSALENPIAFETTGDMQITAEPEHIYEVVKNLVENAVKYNGKNGKVTVKIDPTNKTMTISDNGIGIPPEEQTKIFERFYRVEKSRATKSGGTGLGLSIVKHTCALYGWKLSLQSKLGVGTDITIEF
ncbi:MAG: ATP-binding protein [Defluviitaleaceae bacterium]|nr:ATP-binding protein [Defluviitaleaceae bacterium]